MTAGRRSLSVYLKPKTLLMLVLGFSSGLPFLLVGNTFGYWLRDEGTTLSAIGFLSWVSVTYSMKFLWAPFVDRLRAPVLGRLGLRRSWMALSQIVVGVALCGMAFVGTRHGLGVLGAFALLAAFGAATQDTVIDAWRIESASDNEDLRLITSAYQFGYRVAIVATDALILVIAEYTSWPTSYAIYGVAMGIGLAATFAVAEPARADAVMQEKLTALPLWSPRGIFDAIAGPFIAFFRTHGWIALLMLLAISFYRVPDFMMGPMVNPFYHDIGLTKDTVAGVRGTVSVLASLAGIFIGGLCAMRFGNMRALILGGILQAVAIAAFAILSYSQSHLPTFIAIMTLDSFATSFAGVALVSYMSSLTSLGYTATQYALLASTYALLGKLLKGFSGAIVEHLNTQTTLLHAYAEFFVACGAVGLPGVLLFIILAQILAKRVEANRLQAL